jgi:hypothetical protein
MQNEVMENTMTEAENIRDAAKEDTFERMLKFTKGDFFVGDDQVPLGTEYLAHCVAWTKCWIKFVDKKLVAKKMYRVSRGERPLDRNDLDEIEKANTDEDPWSFQYMLPLENMESGEVLIFTSSSIGGRRAVSELCNAYAKRKLNGRDGQPIIKLAADEMNTKNFGKVPRPDFEIVGWDDMTDDVVKAPPVTSEQEFQDEIPF